MVQQPIDSREMSTRGKCPVCGGENFEWGHLGGQAYYVPGQNIWRLGRNYQYMRVRRCLTCNNLLVFADPELSKRTWRLTMLIVTLVIVLALVAIVLPLILSANLHSP